MKPKKEENQIQKNRIELEQFLKEENVSDSKELVQLYTQIESDWTDITLKEQDVDWEKLQSKIEKQSNSNIYQLYKRIGFAAAILIVVFTGIWGFIGEDSTTFITSEGKTEHILLADGSAISLSPDSKLHVISEGKDSQIERKVILDGEAYFSIAKSDKPFIVATKNAEIKVLGTEFNVKQGTLIDKDVPYTQIDLLSGSVAVANTKSNTETKLEPGTQATLIAENTTTRTIRLDWIAMWKKNRIAFENESLELILSELQRMYETPIHVDSTVNLTQKISLLRSIPKTADSILVEISALKNLTLRKENAQFYLSAKVNE